MNEIDEKFIDMIFDNARRQFVLMLDKSSVAVTRGACSFVEVASAVAECVERA